MQDTQFLFPDVTALESGNWTMIGSPDPEDTASPGPGVRQRGKQEARGPGSKRFPESSSLQNSPCSFVNPDVWLKPSPALGSAGVGSLDASEVSKACAVPGRRSEMKLQAWLANWTHSC